MKFEEFIVKSSLLEILAAVTLSSAILAVVTELLTNLEVVTVLSATVSISILCAKTTPKKLNPLAGAVVNVTHIMSLSIVREGFFFHFCFSYRKLGE